MPHRILIAEKLAQAVQGDRQRLQCHVAIRIWPEVVGDGGCTGPLSAAGNQGLEQHQWTLLYLAGCRQRRSVALDCEPAEGVNR